MTPMKAIRAKCLDCCCGQYKEVELCPCTDCSLHLYRFGKNPNRAGLVNKGSFSKKLTAQQREKTQTDLSEGNYTPDDEEDEKEA